MINYKVNPTSRAKINELIRQICVEVALFTDGSRINLRYDSKSGGPVLDITIVNFEE